MQEGKTIAVSVALEVSGFGTTLYTRFGRFGDPAKSSV